MSEEKLLEIITLVLTKLEDLYARTGCLSIFDQKELNAIRKMIEDYKKSIMVSEKIT